MAVADDRIVGVIMAGNDGRRGFIYHTAVLEEYRRSGIGSQLVEAAVEELKREGIRKAALVVFAKNADGNAFWERNGFSVREDLVYRNRTLLEMERIDT